MSIRRSSHARSPEVPPPAQPAPARSSEVKSEAKELFGAMSLLLTGSLLMVGVFFGAGMLQSGTAFLARVQTLLANSQPEPKVDVRSIVVQQVRGVSELTTAVLAMETVVPTSRDRTIGGYAIGQTTLLYIGYGEVRAGIDLTALPPGAVQATESGITLQLPPPRILDSKVDVSRSTVYDYDRGFLGLGPDVAPELQELAQQKTLEKIVETACTRGLLEEANLRAERVIGQLLTTSGYANPSIQTQPPDATSCLPPTATDSALPQLEIIETPLPSPTL